MAESVDKSFLR